MEYMLMPLKRYADFSGRSRRMEFWMFALFQIIVIVGLFMLGGLINAFESPGGGVGASIFMGLLFLVCLGFFIPGLAVQVRRLHDLGFTGWLVLLGFVPLGGFVLLVFMFLDGQPGDNKYGPDPKGRAGPAVRETFS